MQGKLNIFQRAVLLWDDMHPYNAVHIVRIPQPLDPAFLENTISSYLEENGISGLEIDQEKKRYHYYGGTAVINVKIVEDEGDARHSINREVQNQLNMPFSKTGRIMPFRFFAVEEGNAFYLGLVYFHIVAGADSIILLLKNIVRSYMQKTTFPTAPLDLYPGTYRQLLPFSIGYIYRWLSTLPLQISSLRSSFRPHYRNTNNQSNEFHLICLDTSEFSSLVETAGRWGVTLNDMFLALLLKAISSLTEKRKTSSKRNRLSIASIANIREDLSVTTEVFSIFLSHFCVSHPVPDGITLEQLVRDVHGQTEKIKKYRIYLRGIVEQYFSLKFLSLFSRERQNKFYPKYYPVCAGITNVNLSKVWDISSEDEGIDYIRAVSTGPVCPLVFSFTTVKNALNIGVSYKSSVYSAEDIEKIKDSFSKYIENANQADT